MTAKTNSPATLSVETASTFGRDSWESSSASIEDLRRFWRTHQSSGHLDPTVEAASYWQLIYHLMNRCLFGGTLPNCMITLERHRGAAAKWGA